MDLVEFINLALKVMTLIGLSAGLVFIVLQLLIQERVKAGLERARAQGKQLGRPTVSADVEAWIAELRGQGMGKIKIAKTLGVGVSTVQRVVG